jgi:hypothetical protein
MVDGQRPQVAGDDHRMNSMAGTRNLLKQVGPSLNALERVLCFSPMIHHRANTQRRSHQDRRMNLAA